MIAPPAGVQIWLVAGATDMRRGFDGLAAVIAQQLNQDPFGGALFIFRGRRGHLVKILFWAERLKVPRAKLVEKPRRAARASCSTPSGWSAATSFGPPPGTGRCR